MTVLSTRDVLARALTDHLALYTLPANVAAYHDGSRLFERTHETVAENCGPAIADYLTRSGAVVDVATLADDLCKRLCDMDGNPRLFVPAEVRAVLTAALTERAS